MSEEEKIIKNLSTSLTGLTTQSKIMLSMIKPLLKKYGIDIKPVVIKRRSEPKQVILGWVISFPNEAMANNFIAQAGGGKI